MILGDDGRITGFPLSRCQPPSRPNSLQKGSAVENSRDRASRGIRAFPPLASHSRRRKIYTTSLSILRVVSQTILRPLASVRRVHRAVVSTSERRRSFSSAVTSLLLSPPSSAAPSLLPSFPQHEIRKENRREPSRRRVSAGAGDGLKAWQLHPSGLRW